MLDAMFLTGWGALGITLFMFIPFFLVFMFIIRSRVGISPGLAGQDDSYKRAEWLWLGFVSLIFVGVNIASIGYMPTVATAEAKASGKNLTEVTFTAESWSFVISEADIQVGKPVKFSGKSTDTVHGFALYHPSGDVLFTMMLMPGLTNPTSLIHTFTEPGVYTVRCLEYCGLQHHEMRDEIVVQ